jgi:hypothetical protein
MKATRITIVVALLVGSALVLKAATTRQPGVRRTELQRHDLSVPGREVIQVRVELDPGVAFGRHWHPGEEIVNVLEGSLEYEVEGKRPSRSRPATSCSSRPERSTRRGTSAAPTARSSPPTSSRRGSRSSCWSSERSVRCPQCGIIHLDD